MLQSPFLLQRLLLLLVLFFSGPVVQISQGQNFASPLDIPLVLSSNFGELRTEQFHFGIDIKTNGVTGLNVYAIDSGYLSRIKVEPSGYGRALYITHPNGYMSVYAHLLCFQPEIDRYCKNEQYKKQQFSVDIYLLPGLIKIHKGELIAYSGNAGNTTGPHLHLEVRDNKSQATLNVLRFFNFGIRDTIPPVIEKLYLYHFAQDSSSHIQFKPVEFKVIHGDIGLQLQKNPEVDVPGKFAFGIVAYDLLNYSPNKTGVYDIQLFIDNHLIFEQQMNKLSWNEMHYANSVLDYGHYLKDDEKINRLFVQPNNHLSIYHGVINRGMFDLVDTLTRKVQIRIKDAALNETNLNFTIKGKWMDGTYPTNRIEGNQILMKYNQENNFKNDKLTLVIPQNSLYEDLMFEYSQLPAKKGLFSEIHQIHNRYTPMHKAALLSVKPNKIPEHLRSKLLLINMDEHGKIIWSGGEYKDGYIQAYIRSFGNYAVAIDTIAPIIKPLNKLVKEENYSDQEQIQFTITDNISDIDTYNGYIDGKWVLFEYDAKSRLIYYVFDPMHMNFNKMHTLVINVTDAKGNRGSYRSTFFK